MRVQVAASSRARGWLAEQARAWAEGGFAEHMQADRWAAYQLLAGRIDQVTPALALDWRRALGLHFWCAAVSCTAGLWLHPCIPASWPAELSLPRHCQHASLVSAKIQFPS